MLYIVERGESIIHVVMSEREARLRRVVTGGTWRAAERELLLRRLGLAAWRGLDDDVIIQRLNCDAVDMEIMMVVARLSRDYKRVYPYMVAMWLTEYMHEATVRDRMAKLARRGLLYRPGGENARRGYGVLRGA